MSECLLEAIAASLGVILIVGIALMALILSGILMPNGASKGSLTAKAMALGANEEQYKAEIDRLNKQLQEETNKHVGASQLVNEYQQKNEQLGANEEKYKVEIVRLQGQVTSTTERIESLTQSLEETRQQKEDALMRLSEQASSNLRNNNPNIVDLSDENRPTKIGEKFSELYDNEWTEAYESMETQEGDDSIDDKIITDKLLAILMFVYGKCKERQSLIPASLCPEGIEMPEELQVKIKEQWRKQALKTVPNLINNYISELNTQFHLDVEDDRLSSYIRVCFELCWLMCVQDPPMVLGVEEEGSEFDSTTSKVYTKSGLHVSHSIWPYIRLHEGGPLVSKGVVQCFNKHVTVTSF